MEQQFKDKLINAFVNIGCCVADYKTKFEDPSLDYTYKNISISHTWDLKDNTEFFCKIEIDMRFDDEFNCIYFERRKGYRNNIQGLKMTVTYNMVSLFKTDKEFENYAMSIINTFFNFNGIKENEEVEDFWLNYKQ